MRNAWIKRSKWVALTLVAGAALAAAAVGIRSTGAQSKTGNPSVDARAGNPSGPAARGPGSGFAELSNRYIVVYREEPLATYKGDIQGLAAPERMRPSASAARAAAATGNAPTPRIAVKGARSQDYVRFLADRQVQHEARINAALGRSVKVERRMQHAINASVLQMNPQEAERVRALPDVQLVEEYREYEQDTDVGPGLIGAPALWNGTPAPFRGEGVVVGVIDSGINFGSPAFTARAEDGYEHVNPLGAGNYLGTCAPGGIDEGRCNSKLIGGYDFVCGAPGNQCGVADVREEPGFGDTNGHGSHTASTAAGNPHTASYRGNQIHISGVAPRANIIAYDACYTEVSTGRGFCPNTSTLAAVNQALADGVVDVINYSIAGGTAPWGEAVSLAFLNASDAGIYVATSAGNSGPGPNTMGHLEPWTGSTAAATHGRGDIVLFAAVSGPGSVPPALTAILLTEGSGGVPFATPIPATTPLRVSAGIDSANDGCAPFPANTFQGAVAVIRRGSCNFSDKVNNAAAAGAIAVLIGNNQPAPILPNVAGATIPAFAIDQSDANALRTFASSVGNNATAGIAYPASKISNTPDVLGDFSSRGPAGIFDLVKPDVTAPGVRVLAVIAGNEVTGSENAVGLMDGTSMASPHHAGAAALLRQARPDWTVQETRSALMMTARQEVLKEDGVTPADAFAMGAGRIQVDQALRAGLVLNETKTNFLAANPANGGEVSSLNIASLGKRSCADSCSFTRVFRNVLPTRQTWTAKVQGLTAVVSPSVFTLAPGESKSVRVIVTTGSVPNDGSWRFARLTLAPQGGDTSQPLLRLPIAVSVPPPQIAATPPTNSLTLPAGGSGTVNLQIANTGGSPLEWQIDNSGVGTRTLVAQAPNNANGRRSTRFTDAATVGARAQLGADDFTLGEATGITRIVADGFVNGGSLATSTNINWSIYRDVGGNPEGNPESSPQLALWSYTSTVSGPGVRTSATLATINLDLAAAGQNVNLPAGRYWLVVSVRAPLATSWFWFNATSGDSVYRSAIINPDGSGAWSATAGAPGLAYGLGGSNACGAGWIGTPTRALGRISAGGSQSTQVQINASGLAPGSYSGFVCVGSNDPSTPKTAVRVALTVTP
ncbi:S8 family serine peptidase [Stenotrophomonas maltophilia]|uniref:S8 family serine peptidase n=1 Tax=Stenotrophomonas geniculata TaxID=86188 RepID=UPI0018D45087|nr:S8 family serine peptidase [Stenotrophomonas maltophilia]